MKIIVCGAGLVGYGIARHFAIEGNDVTVIDHVPELIQRINDTLDVRALLGHGAHPATLENAGAQQADILIAVTSSDEVNMVACQVAHSLFGINKKIARIRDKEYRNREWSDLFSPKNIPIDDIISPEEEVGKTVLQRLAVPGAYDSADFGDQNIKFLAMNLTDSCPVVDTPLNQLSELFSDLTAIVVGIQRDGRVFVPRADESMQVGDNIFLVVDRQDTQRAMTIFGHEEKEARKLIIAGAGNVGEYVARHLERSGSNYIVRMIEQDRDRAMEVAGTLKKTVILHGNGHDPELLIEAGVRDAEMVLALTNNDQVNILLAMMARHEGCSRVLCLINNVDYLASAEQIGLDVTINPRATTVSSVLSLVRRGHILRVHTVEDDAAEVLEIEITEASPLAGERIRQIDWPENIRIGAICRNGEVIAPRGSLELKIGDRLVIFVLIDTLEELERLLLGGFADF